MFRCFLVKQVSFSIMKSLSHIKRQKKRSLEYYINQLGNKINISYINKLSLIIKEFLRTKPEILGKCSLKSYNFGSKIEPFKCVFPQVLETID